jgi:hypothetical protein
VRARTLPLEQRAMGGSAMSAFSVVRFRVKPGRDQAFVDAHRNMSRDFPGVKAVNLVKTGERAYCIVAEWNAMDDIVAARPMMIGNLDRIRDMLEDLGGGLGVTDPVSGPVVLSLK